MTFNSLRAGLCVVALVVCCGTATPALVPGGVPMTYEGYVSGIDVIATSGKPVVCLAIISKEKPAGKDEIQIAAFEPRLQSALETASARGAKVEVSYVEKNNQNVLTRVRILDRGGAAKSAR